MIHTIKEYIRHAPRMAGVEVFFPAEGGQGYTVAHIRHDGRRVRYVSGATQLDDVAALSKELEGSQAVLLLHGRGVVHRVLRAEAEGLKEEELFARYFPNARIGDFHVQRYRGQGVSFFSLVRKDVLAKLLDELGGQGIAVISVALGPFAALSFMGYLPVSDDGGIRLDRHRFLPDDGHVADYALSGEMPQRLRSVKLGEEEISERYFTAFAAAALEVQGGMYPRLALAGVDLRRREYYAGQQFRRSVGLILGSYLLVLLINTFFFARYQAAAGELDTGPNEGMAEAVRSLKKEIAEREKVLDGLPLRAGDGPHWAGMADTLLPSMPTAISLEEMDFAPREEGKSRLQRRPVFATGILRIKGRCAEMAPVNEWLAAIRQLAFCRQADLVHYAYNSKDELADFTLEIKLEE